jgi:kynureninase
MESKIDTQPSNVSPYDVLSQLAKDKQLDLMDQQLSTELDERDELKEFRDRFYFPIVEDADSKMVGQEYLYFTGNSLGLQPKTTKKYIEEELDVWRKVCDFNHRNVTYCRLVLRVTSITARTDLG